jgi:hypothetical protein
METDMRAEQLSEKRVAGFFPQPGNSRVASTAGITTVSIDLSDISAVTEGEGAISI